MTDRSLDVLIDEVVLGLADPAEVTRIEALADRDPDIAARLDRARRRFAPLDETVDEAPLPDDLWSRIDATIDQAENPDAPTTDTDAPAAEVVDLAAIRRTMARWKGAAVGGLAAALLLAISLAWSMMSASGPTVVAVLLNDSGEAIALVESSPDNTTRVTLLEPADVPSDRVMQVWTKPEDDGPPVSLGLLARGLSETLTIEGLPAPNARQLYEITVEPEGGSPTNLPTGPILGKGLAKAPLI
ncbi:anti-sigma factor [Psychromarinibacter halotolerans]|uniref:Anti-sigma factor domain-containing protein n=1 Tax=Psychromarinibacter halotolerans TaxID=1775175 RepID=A0ABV7GNR4_9RHOB|nr:anti-sigma factor [Psychromarinibacter halotolerans]MDF0596773.1 anti-sigma factor [Psychromarinibacter halotolerans]